MSWGTLAMEKVPEPYTLPKPATKTADSIYCVILVLTREYLKTFILSFSNF